jgi:alkyl sulfatase BDS1-like metallo-beta-lactamase superfamily hydrolase
MPEENPGLRNSYLSGAFELRSGIPQSAQIADGTAKVEGNTEVLD